MIEDSTSCADENVYSSSECVGLVLDVNTTIYSESVELFFEVSQVSEDSLDLWQKLSY